MDRRPGVADEPTEPANVLIDGRYQLGSLLGSGAVAHVYQAIDRTLDRSVAIKLFRTDPDPVDRQRFRNEAEALARLSHPGLVSVIDAGVHGERPYLVMRLIDGDNLAVRLALRGTLAPAEMCRLGARLADAVAHVHAHGIVHRDIKPSNILLDRAGNPYLADFGIVLMSDVTRLTSTNEVIGTAAYLSPEQVLGDRIGSPSDVYALGLVLLECLTGEVEYGHGRPVEVAVARLHRPPRMPASLPAGLADLLAAMTAREPEDRPTAADCGYRLWCLASGVSPIPLRTRPMRLASERARWGRRAAVGGLAAGAVLAGVFGSLAMSQDASGTATAGTFPTTAHSSVPSTSADTGTTTAPPSSSPAASSSTHDPVTAAQAPHTVVDLPKPPPPHQPGPGGGGPGHGGHGGHGKHGGD